MLSDRQIQAAIKRCTNELTLNDGNPHRGAGSLALVAKRRQSNAVSAKWVARWWVDGKRMKKTLGTYPDVSLQRARALYEESVRGVLAAGRSPKLVESVAAVTPTVQALFDAYCDQMQADGKSSEPEVRRCLKQVAQALGSTRMASGIDPSEVSDFLAGVHRRGAQVYADRFRSYMSAAFNYGIKATHDYRVEVRRDWGIKVNPVSAVPKNTAVNKPRERVLSVDELAAFWRGLDDKGFALETQASLRLLVLLGQRVRETLRMEGRHIDLVAKVWTMPAEMTKTKARQHQVPLPDMAVEVLRQLIAVHGRGPLFPARTGERTVMVDGSLQRAITRWCLDKKAERFQTRDLRRTWKSLAASAGVDRFMRDLIQQHAMGDTGSKHYDKADYMPQMREAMAKWEKWLSEAIQSANGRSGHRQRDDRAGADAQARGAALEAAS